MTDLAGPVALGVFRDGDRAFPGLVSGRRVLDLSGDANTLGLSSVTIVDLVAALDRLLPILEELARTRSDGWHELGELAVDPPIRPSQVIQAGANYRKHVIDLEMAHRDTDAGVPEAEARAAVEAMMDHRAAAGEPYLFIGLPSAITGPFDTVTLPSYSDQHDWELELAAVMGREAFKITREEALGHVAAYTIVNDLTTRDLVFRRDMPAIGTDWLRSKNAPGFLPTGPYLVPAAYVKDPMELTIHLELNGQVMQDETTADMLFDIAAIVSAATQTVRLQPGDLVLTGSPAGNGMHWGRLLRDGDVMESTISGLGTQVTRVVAEGGRG